MKYINKRTGQTAEIDSENKKSKTLILRLDNDKYISMNTSTFHREWEELKND